MVQRKKQIKIEEKEIERTEKELIATVKRPAEAEAYKMQQLAEGQKWVLCWQNPLISQKEITFSERGEMLKGYFIYFLTETVIAVCYI